MGSVYLDSLLCWIPDPEYRTPDLCGISTNSPLLRHPKLIYTHEIERYALKYYLELDARNDYDNTLIFFHFLVNIGRSKSTLVVIKLSGMTKFSFSICE